MPGGLARRVTKEESNKGTMPYGHSAFISSCCYFVFLGNISSTRTTNVALTLGVGSTEEERA